ncbi:TPA: hypothetical protein R6C92_003645 [Pseudomonas aeruginosa]|nr:hypothetical protein [Pseudomonas aeruginosa]
MSSTQHQLIEQCAIRLRGIVEALDNIHDTSPHRWSTDLDDVHSSAESLLALIKDQAPTQAAQGLAGAALAQPSQSQYEASFEEWLANELEGEDGQPVPAAVCDITLARRAFNHWPKLEQPAKVGGVRFSAGVSSRLVVEAAQRLYEFESTPEQEAERIERLQAFREQLDPLNLAPHAEAFNEAPDEAFGPEQAEAERPEVVGYRIMRAQADKIYQRVDKAAAEYEAGRSALGYMEDIAEAALCLRNRLDDLLAAAPAQAQHSVPEGWMLVECGIWTQEQVDEMQKTVARFRNSEFVDDRALAMAVADAGQCKAPEISLAELLAGAPGCHLSRNALTDAQMRRLYDNSTEIENERLGFEAFARLIRRAEAVHQIAAAPGKEAPQAWIDVQAERRRARQGSASSLDRRAGRAPPAD